MKKGMLFGLTIGIALSAALFAIPAFAHGPSHGANQDGTAITQPTGDTWNQMWGAHQSGDWNTMNDAANEFHGGYGTMMSTTSMMTGGYSNGMNGYMGSGMMGGSGFGGGMMGW